MPRKLIGQSMIEAGLINQKQLDALLEFQAAIKERVLLGILAVALNLVGEDRFAYFLASYFGVPYITLDEYLMIHKEALDLIPKQIAERYNVLPLLKENDTLTVAISDPMDLPTLENLETITHCRIKPLLSAPTQIRNCIQRYMK